MIIKLDTGAQLNVMPVQQFNKLNKSLKKSSVVIKAFGGFQIESLGKIKVCVRNKNNKIFTYFEVVEYDELANCLKLEYNMKEICEVKENETEKDKYVRKNYDVFTGFGKFPEKVTIKLKDNAIPMSIPPRRVPNKIINNLKEALNNMTKLKVIEKCVEPIEWLSPIIVVEKPDKSIKVYLDPREINKNVVREIMYQIPPLEQIKLNLSNKTVFTLLDLKDGFYQCELEVKSQKYSCFSTPFECYKFLKLPFGLAPEKFQEPTSKYFGNINNVDVYFDDILVSGVIREDHDKALSEVIERAREFNIKFNPNELQYCVSKVKFLGFIFSNKGVLPPDIERIKVIQN